MGWASRTAWISRSNRIEQIPMWAASKIRERSGQVARACFRLQSLNTELSCRFAIGKPCCTKPPRHAKAHWLQGIRELRTGGRGILYGIRLGAFGRWADKSRVCATAQPLLGKSRISSSSWATTLAGSISAHAALGVFDRRKARRGSPRSGSTVIGPSVAKRRTCRSWNVR
jgi:hypothetical protein